MEQYMRSDLFDLEGMTALVTGGTRGIGRGIVEQFVRHGARVALSSRSQADCDAVVGAERERAGDNVEMLGIAADATSIESTQNMVDAVIAAWGKIDILVCNAAVLTFFGPSRETPDEQFEVMLRGNVIASFRLCHMVAGGMLERRSGSIILITSIAGLQPTPKTIAYGASKAAVTAMARSLAAEFAPNRVRVNCIAPGLIRSEGARGIWENPERLAVAERHVPLGRIGEAEDIGAAAVYLASRASTYVTGITLSVDGGRAGLAGRDGIGLG
jgi:NAD(P)-dependent dehydrogenase (short-subunit alcohol dehydrogenase family)